MTALLFLKSRKRFDGEVFLVYLIVYACGRSVIEMFRGDIERGFVIDGILSNSQLISLLMAAVAAWFYVRLNRINKLLT